ncbi:MAG: NAD-dependent epimerase/dehydratase family protein [Candidatus ainarchaeum sp.]|nr:NAD-dependent epimerase/dehydratase family protein [Candidatus ainarchaeum sp.]
MRIAVTGGAGFIGSHLVDRLVSEGAGITVIDDLSCGKKENISPGAALVRKDIRQDLSAELRGADAVFHLAADPDVRSSAANPTKSFEQNVAGTFAVLESCRKADVKRVVFASTSTVYGEADVIPTPETYPCAPISNYGASKLACEAYLSAYSGSYGIKGTSLRFANIFGERSTHGVMLDFYRKLRANPKEMEILGDGRQDKSYLHVSDCVSATLTAWKKQKAAYDAFNVGSRGKARVDEIAGLMCRLMRVRPKFSYTGTPRGWAGDVRVMLLSTEKIGRLGWKEQVSFEEGVKKYLAWLEKNG